MRGLSLGGSFQEKGRRSECLTRRLSGTGSIDIWPYRLGKPGETRDRVWLRPKNSSHTRIPGAGHLIPQEAPEALGEWSQAVAEDVH